MTFLESLLQFFWAGVDVIRSFFELFQPHAGLYIALVLWIAFWVGAVNWVRLRKILLEGGWTGIVLIGFMAVLVWGCIAPPEGGFHSILGLEVSNFVGKTVYVTGLICIMFICGSIQLAGNPRPKKPPCRPVHTTDNGPNAKSRRSMTSPAVRCLVGVLSG